VRWRDNLERGRERTRKNMRHLAEREGGRLTQLNVGMEEKIDREGEGDSGGGEEGRSGS
jgi:hypothetical protein